MLELVRVDPPNVKNTIPFILQYLERALEHAHDGTSAASMIKMLEDGFYTLWLVKDDKTVLGCVTTGYTIYEDRDALSIITMACDAPREDWLPLLEKLEDFGRFMNCTTIDLDGRFGWAKVLKDYSVRAVTLSKTL